MIKDEDLFGRVLMAHQRGHKSDHHIERNDGYLDPCPAGIYFDSDWNAGESKAVRMVRGCVLDLGCGAGRHALRLQRRGLKVTAIDSSPLAIRVSRERGVKDARVVDIENLGQLSPSTIDDVIMLGNNFGLLGTPGRARRLLRLISRITTSRARIFAGSLNVHGTTNPEHLLYQRSNRIHDRLPGQLRLRVRFGSRVSPWFDWLMVSPSEMRLILRDTGWNLTRVLSEKDPGYVAVLEKRER